MRLRSSEPLESVLPILYCISVEVFQSKVGNVSGFSWFMVFPVVLLKGDILGCATQLLELLFCLWLLFLGYRKAALYPEGSSTPCALLYVIIMLGI